MPRQSPKYRHVSESGPSGCGGASYPSGDTGQPVATAPLTTSSAAPVLVSGHAYHRSLTMAFCEGEARDSNDRLIAKAMGTFKYLKPGVVADG